VEKYERAFYTWTTVTIVVVTVVPSSVVRNTPIRGSREVSVIINRKMWFVDPGLARGGKKAS
jgi:hypothetical protein